MPQIPLEQLQEIKAARDKEIERVKLSIQLHICPTCGADIISSPKETRKHKFLGITFRTTKIWDVRDICSVDKSHYEEKYDLPLDPMGY